MASDWKERLGIPINYSSGDDEVDENSPNKLNESQRVSSVDSNISNEDALLHFDQYGSTPPRTRILRKNRERSQRNDSSSTRTMKFLNAKLNRRNTIGTMFIELIEKAENANSDLDMQGRRNDKRSLTKLRGSERDLKLNIGSSQMSEKVLTSPHSNEERAESMPIFSPPPIQNPTLIETRNRFMSLTSRPVKHRWKQTFPNCLYISNSLEVTYPEDRIELHRKLTVLLQSGYRDISHQMSHEEHMWQNELKDLIWLELQAWHADRTPKQQDAYLCMARESVGQLLQEIMHYKFDRNNRLSIPKFSVSTHSNDSGMGLDCTMKDCCIDTTRIFTLETNAEEKIKMSNSSDKENDIQCSGCLSMYCKSCIEAQNNALREVEYLMEHLEAAEALYPSSKAFAQHYPLYSCPEFVGRVKAMCLWYNLTKHQRLKLLILGKLMIFLQGRHCQWPIGLSDFDVTSSSNGIGTDHSSDETMSHADAMSRSTSVEHHSKNHCVHFEMEMTSPSDSNNSSGSSVTDNNIGTIKTEEECIDENVDYYNVAPIESLGRQLKSPSTSPYRKYIENVLKTKGLRKALYFLELLHETVLRKAQITLQKPPDGVSFNEYCRRKCEIQDNSYDIDECELRRYGRWSPEADELQLPSYSSAFIFLSLVPVQVIDEFMRMRLEQRPNRPSPLSIRQIMRELKEGLKLAVLHRQRILNHINTILCDSDPEMQQFKKTVNEFDESVKNVFEMYLEYIEQWSLMIHYESFQKSMLEEEWFFVKTVCPHVPGTHVIVAKKFCLILTSILNIIGLTLKSRVEELATSISIGFITDEDFDDRQTLLLICRKIQNLFNEEKERSLKTLSFAKNLYKELHWTEFTENEDIKEQVNDGLNTIKDAIISLRKHLIDAIERVQEICDQPLNDELDDSERNHLLLRCREILHQAFKFGFEYHKDVSQFDSNNETRTHIALNLIHFGKMWIRFVMERCERGRGQKPRWAYQGMEYLSLISDPYYTQHLKSEEFEDFKKCIDDCITYIIGTASTPSPELAYSSPHRIGTIYSRSRGSSPQRSRTSSFSMSRQKSGSFRKDSGENHDMIDSPDGHSKLTINFGARTSRKNTTINHSMKAPRSERVRDAINKLEMSLEQQLRSQELIGQVTITAVQDADKIHIKSRQVTFSWQRGIKIGQGRFGKVYTAVNNETGEMLAMKEISLQPNDHKTIKKVGEEIKIFEGIKHVNLVKYYGVEIHREEMLIFMEFCSEGTLETLVAATEGGLPEILIRRYTRQLLSAVATLHDFSVVHRDIKSANIFLTDEGNYIKLGDFGSAVKIKAHTTMPGELQGFVGTQAYMAPEVFMKTNTEGHGRAADIWSVGCVVVEMGSGKRPWAQYDSNYQIMFVVGMGETPEVPERLSDEGKQFLERCLQHDPRERFTARELTQLNFVKVDDDPDLA